MGLLGEKKEAELAVGGGLVAVLPTNPKPWYFTPHLLKLNLCLLVPLFSAASVGYDGSMMNGLQTLSQWRDYFDDPQGAMLGLVNSVYFVGAVVGLFLVTYICDKYGRKVPLYIGFAGAIGFALLQGLAKSFTMFVTARAFLGFFGSFLAQPSPILIAELAYPTQRGKLTSLYQTSYYFGAILAAWLTYGTFRIDSTWSWRIPSILQGAVPLVQACGLFLLPESPRWLVSRGRSEEARKILAKCHAGGDIDSPLVDFEINEIEAAVREESEILSGVSWFELFRTPANRKRTLIAVLVGWFTQWNGVGVISYYLTLVLNTVGITATKDQTLINGLLQIFNWLVAVFGGAMMVDRIGRRKLFLISSIGMLITYIVWTGLTASFVTSRSESTGRAVVALIFVYFFFYDIAFTPLPQTYIVEVFPYTLRGRGLSTMYISTFVGLIVGNQVNPIAMKAIAWKYYIVFICLLALLVVIVWFLFPETKGHTLEEIREVFEGKLNVPQNKLGSAELGEAGDKASEMEARADRIEG